MQIKKSSLHGAIRRRLAARSEFALTGIIPASFLGGEAGNFSRSTKMKMKIRRKCMKKNLLGLAMILGSSVTGLLPAASGQAMKDVNVVNSPNVNVVNTPAVTVANTPTVNVGNTPSVNITNTPSVSITNTPTVNIASTTTQPLVTSHIDEPGRVPFQQSVTFSSKTCAGQIFCSFDFGPVPAGHRLVIQRLSGKLNFDGPNNYVWIELRAGLQGSSGIPLQSFFVPLRTTDLDPTFTASVFSESVLAYVEPTVSGVPISAVVQVRGGSFPKEAFDIFEGITVTGYLLDCTAAPCAPIAP